MHDVHVIEGGEPNLQILQRHTDNDEVIIKENTFIEHRERHGAAVAVRIRIAVDIVLAPTLSADCSKYIRW